MLNVFTFNLSGHRLATNIIVKCITGAYNLHLRAFLS